MDALGLVLVGQKVVLDVDEFAYAGWGAVLCGEDDGMVVDSEVDRVIDVKFMQVYGHAHDA